jgi:beta-lactamase superfamily II metal-dependent hydrolase
LILLLAVLGCAENTPNPFDAGVDSTPPSLTSVSFDGKTVTWTSNEDTRGVVEYGPVGQEPIHYAYESDRSFDTEHDVELLSLNSYSTYGFRVRLYDRAGNETLATDSTGTFTTNVISPDPELSLHMLDVGSALCMLLVSPSGTTVLIDSGDSGDIPEITEYLRDIGISTLDYAVATHLHADHIGGFLGYGSARSLIREFRPTYFLDVPTHTAGYENQYRDLMGELTASGMDTSTNYFRVTDGATNKTAGYLSWDPSVEVMVLHAGSVGDGNPNNDSMALRFSYGDVDFITTGDCEFAAENEMISEYSLFLESEVWQVGHHGNDDASQERFIDSIDPLIALISNAIVDAPLQKESVLHDIRVRLIDYFITDKVYPNTPRSSSPTYGNIVVSTDGEYMDVTLDLR